MLKEILHKKFIKEDLTIEYPKDCDCIDEIKPGFIFNISFWPLQEENFYETHKKWEDNIEKDRKLRITFPAIVIEKSEVGGFEFPSFKVAFLNRWRSGELSGWLYFEDLLIWRYFPNLKDDFKNNIPQEGLIPNWFIDIVEDTVKNSDLFKLTLDDIYYTKIENGKRVKYYPFRGINS